VRDSGTTSDGAPAPRAPCAGFPSQGPLWTAFLRVEEVLDRVTSQRKLGDFLSQLLGRDRRVPDLAALAVDAEAPPGQVKVALPDRSQLALTQPHEEEHLQRNAITEFRLGGNDPANILDREQIALHVAEAR